jgi:hypothetical protein
MEMRMRMRETARNKDIKRSIQHQTDNCNNEYAILAQ